MELTSDGHPITDGGGSLFNDEAVEAAATGSRVALRQIIQALVPQVGLMVAARINLTPDRFHVIDELTQQALMALVAGIQRLKNRTTIGLKCFLSMIVAHKVADFLRQRRSASHENFTFDSTTETSTDDVVGEALMATDTTPGRAAERAEQIQRVMRELATLRPNYREIIVLAFFDQLPTGEIAERLGISRPAASMLLIRAVGALRENLKTDAETTHGKPA